MKASIKNALQYTKHPKNTRLYAHFRISIEQARVEFGERRRKGGQGEGQ